MATLMLFTLVLTGCSSTNQPIDPNTTNFWDRYILYNMSQLLIWISKSVGNNPGLAIIIFTIVVKIILLPLNVISMRNMKKMSQLKPQMDEIKKKYPGKDAQSQRQVQVETQKLYSEQGINPISGCLPMLPQLPILLALYSSILRTPELQVGRFLWMELGKADPYFIMPILSALLTLATSYISSMQQPDSNATTKIMTFVPAIMILIVGLNLPSALTIYWVASNLFQLAQTFIFQNPFKYQREMREKEQQERDRRRKINKAKKKIYKK
ncbi:membrane protein insertase YidC [Holzapfeliella sp. He02]|uniref:Membrane protein insertase YidC n=1 Tax=Holzapfeliella saturejae TaxID=3082953 RepID=A0ABU8SEL1_9LACO